MSPRTANLRGIIMMLLSGFVFIVNDAMIKVASEHLPTGQILVMRGSIAFVVIVALVFATGAYRAFRLTLNRFVAWRTFGEVAATLTYLYALFNMPLANLSAIGQVVPLMTTAAAAIFLAEPVGWRRWLAIAIGFAGVMIIVRPGVAGFDLYSIAAIASMALITMRDLVTRSFPIGIPTLLVTAITAAAVMVTGGVLALGETWPAPTWRDWLLLGGAGCLLLIGYGTSILAMREGAVAVVAPFRYAPIVFAIIIGYTVWGDVPDLWMIVGTLIVVATGIYSFHRERLIAMRAGSRSATNPSSA